MKKKVEKVGEVAVKKQVKAEEGPAGVKKMGMMMGSNQMMDNIENNEEPAAPGNSQGEFNMQNHRDELHQRNNKK